MQNLPIYPLKTLTAALQDRKLHTVAKRCKLSYPTLLRIANGKETNFNTNTLQVVSDYLRETEIVHGEQATTPKPVISYSDCLSPAGIGGGLIKPDYQKHLTDHVTVHAVDVLSDYVVAAGQPTQLVVDIVHSAGGGTIANLDQDGLQKVFFELTLLEVGATLTFERVQHQGRYNQPVPDTRLHSPSLAELKQLVQCVKKIGWTSNSIRKSIRDATYKSCVINKTVVKGTKLSDLDWVGRDFVYRDFVRVLMNERAYL